MANSKHLRTEKKKFEAWARTHAYSTRHKETFWGLLRKEAAREFGKYLENPCVHGLKYLERSSYPLSVRVAWGVLLALSVFGLVFLTAQRPISYLRHSRQTLTVVAETRVDTTHYPFPSVTVCPLGSIVKSDGQKFLERITGLPVENVSDSLMEVTMNFFKELQEFRFPLYSDTWKKEAQSHNFLNSFNVRELMLNASPACENLLMQCSWNGIDFNCCDKFELQETNWGFCYAFNSCTSLARKEGDCTPLLGVSEEETGLYFQTYLANESELLNLEPISRGLYVVLSNPYEIPIPSNGFYVGEFDSNVIRMSVSLTVQDADDDLRDIPWRFKNCKFREDHPLSIARYYSQEGCIETCRLTAMAARCGCIPFHFSVIHQNDPQLGESGAACVTYSINRPSFHFMTHRMVAIVCAGGYRVCDAIGMSCIFYIKDVLRQVNNDITIGQEYGRSLNDDKGINCECPPECVLLLYDFAINVMGDTVNRYNISAAINVYQRNAGPANIRYFKRLSVTFSEFLANLGNIAALFLGISILSVLEFIIVLISIISNALTKLWNARRVAARTELKFIPFVH